jgi:hypothetical protein
LAAIEAQRSSKSGSPTVRRPVRMAMLGVALDTETVVVAVDPGKVMERVGQVSNATGLLTSLKGLLAAHPRGSR